MGIPLGILGQPQGARMAGLPPDLVCGHQQLLCLTISSLLVAQHSRGRISSGTVFFRTYLLCLGLVLF